jgi:adenine-specific DNA-methyltransferase
MTRSRLRNDTFSEGLGAFVAKGRGRGGTTAGSRREAGATKEGRLDGGGTKGKRPIEQYDHKAKTRLNNPPVGLVTEKTDPPITSRKTYGYDPHLDPQLIWAGKKEHTSFEVPTVSLHVHERIDPRTIIEAVRKRNGVPLKPAQGYLFEAKEENPPLREAVDFYRHPHGWTNRLIAGDSLLVMNSLLEKEGMAGQVQMVYIDPPYGIRYGSNFQPFVNRRDVKDGKDEDLTQEPEMVRAFRDTWELGIHSYLTYLRDRLLLARDLLHESGSCFVQISDVNVHHVREVLQDVFGDSNFAGMITFRKTSSLTAGLLSQNADFILWYAKDRAKLRYRQLFVEKGADSDLSFYAYIELPSGERRRMTSEEVDRPIQKNARLYSVSDLTSSHEYGLGKELFTFEDKAYSPGSRYWTTSPEGMKRLAAAKRLHASENSLRYIRYFDDFPYQPLTANWTDTITGQYSDPRIYVVQTAVQVIERCILMTTDPGDLVFDPTCGSGTTAVVAEQWGRRWITCDTSRVATTLAKQRLMSATFDYYKLAHPDEGVGSGFQYKKVPHVTLKSIANNEPPGEETLYDQPLVDSSRARIAGPFTVEAVPAPNVKSLDEIGAGEEERKKQIPHPAKDAGIRDDTSGGGAGIREDTFGGGAGLREDTAAEGRNGKQIPHPAKSAGIRDDT